MMVAYRRPTHQYDEVGNRMLTGQQTRPYCRGWARGAPTVMEVTYEREP